MWCQLFCIGSNGGNQFAMVAIIVQRWQLFFNGGISFARQQYWQLLCYGRNGGKIAMLSALAAIVAIILQRWKLFCNSGYSSVIMAIILQWWQLSSRSIGRSVDESVRPSVC